VLRVRGTAIGLVLVVLAGCTGGGAPEGADADCAAPAVSSDGVVGLRADGGTVTALLFGTLPAETGSTFKIVWRVTGEGDLTVQSLRPDGSKGKLAWAPEPHEGSNFVAPGEEWGTGFAFDSPGCWQVNVRRDGVTAHLAIPVVDG
jgi:hypothetical protein